jgi:ADP-ribose pyrophosphatase YjhB (NUDIX family)
VTDVAPAKELPRWTRVAAYAVCRDDAGRLLLVRIADGYSGAGKWTLPGGGLEFGEDPQDAVVRELAEETGLTGRVGALEFVNSHTHGGLVENGQAYGPWHGIRIVYRVQITGGSLHDEVDESTDTAAWFTLADATELPLTDLAAAALRHLEAA